MSDRRTVGAGRSAAPAPSQRIDLFLWYVRLAPSRSAAQALAERAIIRLNGRRIDKAHSAVRPGDLVTIPHGAQVRVIRILALPARRGPASEAQCCYETLQTDSTQKDIFIDAGAARA